MIKIDKGIAELSGDRNEILNEFVVMLSAYKHFVNKTLFPDDPDKAYQCLMTGLAVGFKDSDPFTGNINN